MVVVHGPSTSAILNVLFPSAPAPRASAVLRFELCVVFCHRNAELLAEDIILDLFYSRGMPSSLVLVIAVSTLILDLSGNAIGFPGHAAKSVWI